MRHNTLILVWESRLVALVLAFDTLCQCGLQVAQRWAGVPNQELIKQAEARATGPGASWELNGGPFVSTQRSAGRWQNKKPERFSVNRCRTSFFDLLILQFCRNRWNHWCKTMNIHYFVIEKETSMLRQHIKRVERKCPFGFVLISWVVWLWCSFDLWSSVSSCQRPELAGTKSYKAMLERCRRQCQPWPANWWRLGTAIALYGTLLISCALRCVRHVQPWPCTMWSFRHLMKQNEDLLWDSLCRHLFFGYFFMSNVCMLCSSILGLPTFWLI